MFARDHGWNERRFFRQIEEIRPTAEVKSLISYSFLPFHFICDRLWGDHGQTTLEDARVCLLNATATGTETLKNVVLPGCGSFVVVDGEKVTEEDVGSK